MRVKFDAELLRQQRYVKEHRETSSIPKVRLNNIHDALLHSTYQDFFSVFVLAHGNANMPMLLYLFGQLIVIERHWLLEPIVIILLEERRDVRSVIKICIATVCVN